MPSGGSQARMARADQLTGRGRAFVHSLPIIVQSEGWSPLPCFSHRTRAFRPFLSTCMLTLRCAGRPQSRQLSGCGAPATGQLLVSFRPTR